MRKSRGAKAWRQTGGRWLLVCAALVQIVTASAVEARDPTPRFDREIHPWLKAHCLKCHGPNKQEGKFDLSTPGALARGGENGPPVQPGSLEGSLLWQRVVSGEMPPEEPVPAEDQARLQAWIAAGAKGMPDPDSSDPSAGDHWAFRRLQRPPVPPVSNGQRVRTDIDRFIQSRLEEEGLGLSRDADRSTLIRRVSFDLTGLPPTPAEITAFLEDSADGAYARLVERLLESPRYGEHWGRYWLDVAGYAESNGYFDADSDRPLAWRYRDYVIRATNSDVPFDQFLREQIAGDEMTHFVPDQPADPRTIELLEATHFLLNGPDGTRESDGNPDEVLTDRRSVLDATVEIWGSALFGLTLKCARCHDHKFEPVKQTDYYQLHAVLAPAFNVDRWVTPNSREIFAPRADELAAFNVELRGGRTTEELRPGRIACVTDLSGPVPDIYIPVRGDYTQRGEIVAPAGLRVLSDADNPFIPAAPNAPIVSTGRRTAFAAWLTRPDSRPAALLARVQVNRIWMRYFGRGLSATPENLGCSGGAPSHPELLEWLAADFVQSGWSLKRLHRSIVTSGVYRQTHEADANGLRLDPDNHWLWRMPLRRLEAEQVRDALLAASGELDLQMGGPAIPTIRTGVGEVLVDAKASGRWRRTVYLQRRRSQVPTLLRVFDAPVMVTNCVERPASTVPLQSLTVLNSEFVQRCAASMSRRLSVEAGLDSDQRIAYAFQVALGREPDGDEMRFSLQFVRNQTRQHLGQSDTPQRQAWTEFCHSLLACNAFLYVD